LDDLHGQPNNEVLRRLITRCAQSVGFFSVWMTVFREDADMCKPK
jgi:hypothetical protein